MVTRLYSMHILVLLLTKRKGPMSKIRLCGRNALDQTKLRTAPNRKSKSATYSSWVGSTSHAQENVGAAAPMGWQRKNYQRQHSYRYY